MSEYTISILGVEYKVQVGTHEEVKLDDTLAGDCDVYEKVIRLRTDISEHLTPAGWHFSMRATFRHEVAHAMLYESGLVQFFDNETIVEWLEVQTPKLISLDEDFKSKFDIHFKA